MIHCDTPRQTGSWGFHFCFHYTEVYWQNSLQKREGTFFSIVCECMCEHACVHTGVGVWMQMCVYGVCVYGGRRATSGAVLGYCALCAWRHGLLLELGDCSCVRFCLPPTLELQVGLTVPGFLSGCQELSSGLLLVWQCTSLTEPSIQNPELLLQIPSKLFLTAIGSILDI